MKPIKLVEGNKAKVQAELDRVNGRASAHCYTDADEIYALARYGEGRLSGLLTAKKDFKGATMTCVSGSSVSNAYAKKSWKPRIATRVLLLRGSVEWYLTSIAPDEIYSTGGSTGLRLTPTQDALAIHNFRNSYAHEQIHGWLTPRGEIVPWGVFTDEDSARAAFALVSGQK